MTTLSSPLDGNDLYEAGIAYLEGLFSRHHSGSTAGQQIVIDGVAFYPRTAAQVVRLHVEDTPAPMNWLDTFHRYVENLPNFSMFAKIYPLPLRGEVSTLALGDAATLGEAVANLGSLVSGPTPIEALEQRCAHLRETYERQDSSTWPIFIRGVAEGLSWLAKLEEDNASFHGWVQGRISVHKKGAVGGPLVWGLVNEVARKGLTWMGPAVTTNFLKDMGMPQFAKPDTHTKKIIGQLYDPACNSSDELAFLQIVVSANQAGVWPRHLDRVLWLIGSGKFHYLQGGDRAVGGSSDDRVAAFLASLQ